MRNHLFQNIPKLKFLMILGVVFIHSNYLNALQPNLLANLKESCTPFLIFLETWDNLVLRICVPAFFAISGFLFFKEGPDLPKHLYLKKLKSRSKTLLVPYLLWNTIGLLSVMVKKTLLLRHYFPQYEAVKETFLGYAAGFFSLPHVPYPYDFPLWFIRNLILIIIISPLLSLLLSKAKEWSLILLYAVYYIFKFTTADIDANTFDIPEDIVYFFLGAWLGCLKPEFLNLKGSVIISLVTAYISISMLIQLGLLDISFNVISHSLGICILLNVCKHLVKIRIPSSLLNGTFFIYAFHGLFCTVVYKLFILIFPPVNSIICFADYILIFAFLLLSSYTVYLLSKKLLPRLTAYLTGGRTNWMWVVAVFNFHYSLLTIHYSLFTIQLLY